MARTDADVEGFLNDLDSDEVHTLVNLVAGIDPLATEDGKPLFIVEEINLVQRFQQFAQDFPEGSGDDGGDTLVVDGPEQDVEAEEENDGDIPGTGEIEPEDEKDAVATAVDLGL